MIIAAPLIPLIAGMTSSVTAFCVALLAVSASVIVIRWLEGFILG